ncbi:MAG: hypothetical protein WC624_04965 [Candidatus Margulisiibacteriota bacterium]
MAESQMVGNTQVFGDTSGGGIDKALEVAAVSLNSFINSVKFLDGTQQDASQAEQSLYSQRGAGFYATNPWTNDPMKVDDIDGQYKAGKITESATNLVQVSMNVEQADKGARKTVTNVLG